MPNEADFEQAGKSTNNLQVSISNDLIKSWQNAATIAFSKTDDKKIKLANTNLDNTFQKNTTLTNLKCQFKLEKRWKLFFCDMTQEYF